MVPSGQRASVESLADGASGAEEAVPTGVTRADWPGMNCMDDPHPWQRKEELGETRRPGKSPSIRRGGPSRAGGGDHRPNPIGGQSWVRDGPRRSFWKCRYLDPQKGHDSPERTILPSLAILKGCDRLVSFTCRLVALFPGHFFDIVWCGESGWLKMPRPGRWDGAARVIASRTCIEAEET